MMKTKLQKDLRWLLPCVVVLALFVLALCLCSGRFSAEESSPLTGKCGENVTWTLDGHTLTIEGTGEMRDLHFDDKEYGIDIPWYKIRLRIREVIIADGVTAIGDSAFRNCCYLQKITIPNSVARIGYFAFIDCTGFTEINIPNSVTEIGYGAFSGCTGLTEIVIPSSVTTIGYGAFSGCTGLTEIHIPSSVAEIDGSAFSGCTNLQTITVEPDNPNYFLSGDCLIERTKKEHDYQTGEDTIVPSNTLIRGCDTSVIPDDGSVTEIGGSAFEGCTGLTEISIPSSVTGIDSYAFSGCTGLTKINIPSSVTYIGQSAFSDCMGLAEINIPNSVTTIGYYAFSGCTGLTEINIPNSVTRIDSFAFSGCTGLTEVNIPSSVQTIYGNPFTDCSGLQSITVDPENPVYYSEGNCLIKKGTKYNGTPYVSLIAGCNSSVIPDDVTGIEQDAFFGCAGLTEINIPSSVQDIVTNPFRGCSSLQSITVDPENPVFYGEGNCLLRKDADYNGDSYVSLITGCKTSVIPDDETRIASYAFAGCTDLTEINIPSSVTTIWIDAFSGCTGLTEINIPSSVQAIIGNPFRGCSGLQSITVDPENPVYYSEGNCLIEKGTNYEGTPYVSLISGCRTSVIPNDGSITEIVDSAFESCTGLTEIIIPEGVEHIWSRAFADCTNLTTVNIPKSTYMIHFDAFEGCDRLSVATYAGTQDEWENNVEIDEGNDPLLLALPFYKDKGDVDGNPGVSVGDRTYLARALAGWEGYAVDPAVADLTGDGEVTAADRTYLARYLAGWEGYALE